MFCRCGYPRGAEATRDTVGEYSWTELTARMGGVGASTREVLRQPVIQRVNIRELSYPRVVGRIVVCVQPVREGRCVWQPVMVGRSVVWGNP